MKKIATLLLFVLLTCILSISTLAEADKPFAGEEITIYNSYDYIVPEVLDLFTEETGITVNYATFYMNEDMYTRVSTGAGKYDVIFPAEYMVERMLKENLLEELNRDNIPNFANVLDSLRGPSFDPENAYSVPYMWGTVGILYNTDLVEEPITSWGALADERYAGSVYMLDSVRDAIGPALKYLGYSYNSHNVDEIEEAGQWLLAQKASGQVAGYILEV